MASRTTKLLAGIGLFIAVSFGIHYALFGSLPICSPAMLDDDSE